MTDCIIWQKCIAPMGYGQLKRNGKVLYAHRWAWEQANGPIPPGAYVLHSCDVRACVNPDHLFIGSHADNMADCAAKGRNFRPVGHTWTRGVKNGQAKLTEDDVRAIRADDRTITEIAKEYGVARVTIRKARNREQWAHVV